MTTRRLLLLAALAASCTAAVAATEPLKAGVFEPPRAAPEVALRGSDGRDFKLANYRGKVVLLAFGFTSCPAVCPTTLATLAQARGELGAAAADVQVVFVTVDPERDDVARLKAYVTAFDPAFVGATGEPAALERARQGFGATATKVPVGSGFAFDHTSSVFIVDRQGRLRGMMPYGRSARDYVHDLRILLAAK
jgi:protein SCO1/2